MQYGTAFARYPYMTKKVFIRQNSWLARLVAKRLGFLRVAVVIGRHIYLHNATAQEFIKNKRWLLHELKHVEQFEIGFFRFIKEYFRELRKNGYDNNKFEVEARAAENDARLLEKYDLIYYIRYQRRLRRILILETFKQVLNTICIVLNFQAHLFILRLNGLIHRYAF